MEPAAATRTPPERTMPRRRGKPRIAASTPRERVVLDPGEHCPDCGGALCLVGEAVAVILDLVAAPCGRAAFGLRPCCRLVMAGYLCTEAGRGQACCCRTRTIQRHDAHLSTSLKIQDILIPVGC